VATVLAVGLGAVAYFSFVRGSAGSGSSSSPTVDIHSKEAVIAAVRHYYDVEAEARKTGNADLIDPVTTGHASLASQNFHVFVADQTRRGKRSINVANFFTDWSVVASGDRAAVQYTFWARGHDIEYKTGTPLEPDVTTTKGSYAMTMELRMGVWLAVERRLLRDNVP
jgi:hypothetical protein